ncbi:hypothetical protein U1769_13220 [Sphingomonas sp. ZT3P38]|uniref:hypothetical protein n=1 Tax=Parasphingomonas zepuensis TaxID=3096161 RepID=UPI002FCB7712
MKVTVAIYVAALFILASCSNEHESAPDDKWVTASSLRPSTVPYTPKPLIIAHEESVGRWVWLPEKAQAKPMSLDNMVGEIAIAKTLRPEPLVLFSFARYADRAKLIETKSRIADALGCSSSSPCIEGTPEQLR